MLLAGLWGALSLAPRSGFAEVVRSFAREFAVVMTLLGIWQYIGRFVRTHVDGAYVHARWVQNFQHTIHLPDELKFQELLLPHEWLVRSMNTYYAFAHLNGMALFLVWVWWRRRPAFRTVRNTIVGTTLICLVVQAIPVAPPRLLPNTGYVDTALRYGQSVYGEYATGVASQLTAMRLCTSPGPDRVLVRHQARPRPAALYWGAAFGDHRAGRGRHGEPLVAGRHRCAGIMLLVIAGQWFVARWWNSLQSKDAREPVSGAPAVSEVSAG